MIDEHHSGPEFTKFEYDIEVPDNKTVIMHAQQLRPHWVCHFKFWHGPIDGLVEINSESFYARSTGGVRNLNYELWPIVLTEECQRWLEDYREAYRHTFYVDGVRSSYDGRPLTWFHEKWPVNPIVAMVKDRIA